MGLFYKAYKPAIALLMAAGMWLYVLQIMLPFERQSYAAIGQPENVGDLYPSWYGSRELLLRGRDPYSRAIAGEIQTAYFGHPLDFKQASDRGKDDQRFYYPLYVAFFLAPTVAMPFPAVQILMRCVLVLATAVSVLLWFYALRWRPRWPTLLTVLFIALSCPAFVQGIKLQQLGLLVAFFLAACAALITRGNLFWAGFFLALATLKPQLAVVPVAWLLIWSTGDWSGRQRLLWGFGGTMAALLGAAQLLSPGWLGPFLSGLRAYPHHVAMDSLLDLYLTPVIATPAGLVALVALAIAGFRWRQEAVSPDSFFGKFSMVLAVAILILPTLLPPFNQILLLPGFLILIRHWKNLSNGGRVVKGIGALGRAVFFWPWLAAPILVIVHLLARSVALGNLWLSPLAMSFGVPPLLLVLLLTWISKKDAVVGVRETV